MIKIVARIMLEVIVNEQINILTQNKYPYTTLSCVYTQNFFSLVFNSFWLFPFNSLTTLAFYHSTSPHELL